MEEVLNILASISLPSFLQPYYTTESILSTVISNLYCPSYYLFSLPLIFFPRQLLHLLCLIFIIFIFIYFDLERLLHHCCLHHLLTTNMRTLPSILHNSIKISETGGDTYKNPRPMILTVVDLGGLCIMTIPSRWLDLDQPVITKIELRDYTKAVVGITLLLLRTEYIHDVRTAKHTSRDFFLIIIFFFSTSLSFLLSSIFLYIFSAPAILIFLLSI